MNPEIAALIPDLPWLSAVLLAVIVLLFQLHRIRGLRIRQQQLEEHNNQLELHNTQLSERLNAHDENLLRERDANIKCLAAIKTERLKYAGRLEQVKGKLSSLQISNASLRSQLERISVLTEERDQARSGLAEAQQQHALVEREFAAFQAKSVEEQRSAEEKIVLLQQTEQRMLQQFEHLANRIFEEKQQTFNQISKSGVEALLGPMRVQLSDFRKRVDEVYDRESEQRTTLRAEISQLKSLNERISSDALNLTRALKGDSKVRGNWGEMQLQRLLEESGLVRGREYDIQVSLRSDSGERFQPDVVVHLPDKRDVVIDAKVSLVAYEQYYRSDAEGQQAAIQAHIASLRSHISGLSSKNYDELTGINSLDLVIMFVPIEPALLLALEHQPNLYHEAFEKGILLVSPTTLMATLQIINNMWRYEYQNRNSVTIASEAGKLHDQFVLFIESLDQIGEQIRRAGESFDTARRRLVDGRGNLVGRVHKLQQLGAKTKKSLPADMLEQSGEES